MDWKDQLGALLPDMPEGDAAHDQTTIPDDAEAAPRKKPRLHVAVEKKGRGGKTATIIYGFDDDDPAVAEVAAILKRRLGVGGSARGGEILIQGNLRDKVIAELRKLSYII